MRNKDTHTRITDKCRCLFVVAYSAMSITGLSSVLAVENHALSSPVSDRVESVQQKKHVSGNVQDANGMPLIGASVIIKGTNTGMITDIEGNFALDAKQGDIIVISYIGMKSAEVKVPANGQIRVMLKEDSQLMDEVVVTGYGDFKKATYTGSASVLNTDKLESLPVVSVAQMMEANIPGLSSVASSSQPGSKATVRVRGIASMNASTEPLYVLDGVPVASRDMSGLSANASAGGLGLIETLNPADIESITVLKDAASASLYGAKGSNGVILITTKKGKEGKMRVSMQATYGITDIAYNYRPIMGGEERRELIYEGFVNYRLNQGDSEAEAKAYADGQIDNYAARPANGYADWEDALLKKGHQQDYSLSVSGGNEKSNFIGTLGYTNQTGISINSGMERFTGRIDANSKWNKFEYGMNATFSWTRNKHTPEGQYYASALYSSKYQLTPSIPIYNEDGSYHTGFQNNGGINPLYENSVDSNYARLARTMASAKAAYHILDGLKLSTIFTVDYSLNKDFFFYSPDGKDGEATQGSGQMMMIERMSYTSQTNLAYNKTFGKHNINAVLAYEVMKYDYEDMYGEKQVYGQTLNPSLDNGAKPADLTNTRQEDAMVSYVGSLNYGYNDKYYAGFSFRRDGSSRLAPDTRWGNFWAVSASWRLSQENFMKPWENVVSDMKLRASYGVNGNLPTGYYGYHGTYTTGAFYNGKPAPWEDAIANPDLTWEKNYALNLGVDLSLFRRVNLTFDWYTRTTKDLLMSKQLNSISGFGSILTNVGEMKNTGFEIVVNYRNQIGKDFNYNVGLNMSTYKTEVTKLTSEYLSGNTSRTYVGGPIGRFWGYKQIGIFQNQEEIDNYVDKNGTKIQPNAQPGDFKFAKLGESGELNDDDDRTFIGDPNPDLIYGFNLGFSYKNFDVSMAFQGTIGNDIWNVAKGSLASAGRQNALADAYTKAWTKDGDLDAVYPRITNSDSNNNMRGSSFYVENGSYLRLQNMQIGYTLPSHICQKSKLFSSCRFYVSGQNIFTLTGYSGLDPELGINNPLDMGVDTTRYPSSRTFTFGVNLQF